MPDSNENQVIISLSELTNKIETLIDKQEELGENIAKIKEAVYNPDQGLYARLRELESWKNTSSRLIWLIITTVLGLGTATIYKSFF